MMLEDDISSHRTRTNRRPEPPTLHPESIAELEEALDDVIQDRN